MKVLFRTTYDEESCEIFPLAISEYDWVLKRYLNSLLKDSLLYDTKRKEHIEECKKIIRTFLLENKEAIVGWNDVRAGCKGSFPLSDKEKNDLINFLCANYSFCYGDNIVEVPYHNSPIPKYCDINKLKRPFPKLPESPKRPIPYYREEDFEIKEVINLDEN